MSLSITYPKMRRIAWKLWPTGTISWESSYYIEYAISLYYKSAKIGCSASFCAQDMAQREASIKKKSWGTMGGRYSSNLISFGPYLKAPGPKRSGFLAVFAFLGQVGRVVQGARPGHLLKFKKAITKTCGEWVGEHHTKRALLYLQKKWGATVKN